MLVVVVVVVVVLRPFRGGVEVAGFWRFDDGEDADSMSMGFGFRSFSSTLDVADNVVDEEEKEAVLLLRLSPLLWPTAAEELDLVVGVVVGIGDNGSGMECADVDARRRSRAAETI